MGGAGAVAGGEVGGEGPETSVVVTVGSLPGVAVAVSSPAVAAAVEKAAAASCCCCCSLRAAAAACSRRSLLRLTKEEDMGGGGGGWREELKEERSGADPADGGWEGTELLLAWLVVVAEEASAREIDWTV